MNRRLFLAATLLAGLSAVPAMAQTAPPTRVRGTIESLNGNLLTVKSRTGDMVEILVADTVTVVAVKKIKLSAIGPNSYIGTATRTAADGKMTAIEVLVFPEAMRGAGEGHYAWDLEPGSMMTNGTVNGAVTAAAGRELTVGYKDGSKTIFVPPNAPVVTFEPAARADVKAGVPVFLAATKNADGKWTAARLTIGKDGVAPPM